MHLQKLQKFYASVLGKLGNHPLLFEVNYTFTLTFLIVNKQLTFLARDNNMLSMNIENPTCSPCVFL